MTRSLEGRAVLITGAGHGIGRATALRMAAQGAIVGIIDIKQVFVDAAVAEVQAAGGQAVGVTQNVSTRDGIRAAVRTLADAAGRLDVLVNNAARVRYQAVADIAPDTVERMLDVGFKRKRMRTALPRPHSEGWARSTTSPRRSASSPETGAASSSARC